MRSMREPVLHLKKFDRLCRWILLFEDGTECELKGVLEAFSCPITLTRGRSAAWETDG